MTEDLKQFDDIKQKEKVEQKYFEDLIVLGNAVPDEISDNRKTVCTVAYSKEYGLIRIYPVPPISAIKRWHVISVPLERNTQDNRNESWKIQNSKTEWNTLSNKIKFVRKLSRNEWINLVEELKIKYGYGCIEDINDKKLSLGIIVPKIISKQLDQRKNVDLTVQTTLENREPFLTINNYQVRPTITYQCPKCRTKKGNHTQGVLEWGFYEWIRNNKENPEQVWNNTHIGESGFDFSFLVGNMNRHRSRFLIISIFRYKI